MDGDTNMLKSAFPHSVTVRSGNIAFDGERTIWFHGVDQEDFAPAITLARALSERFGRLDYLFSSPDSAARNWLREQFPGAVIAPPPWPIGLCVDRYLTNINVRCLVLLGTGFAKEKRLFDRARKRLVPVVAIVDDDGRQIPAADAAADILAGLEHGFALSGSAAEMLSSGGLAEDRLTVCASDKAGTAAQMADRIGPMLGRDLKLARSNARPLRQWLELLVLKAMERRSWRRVLAVRAERLDTIKQLHATLGGPQTILCLGNGPSSEDPALRNVAHDCLFRVNHLWLERGFLASPDVVFTGSKQAIAAVKGTMFALQTIKSEARLVAAQFVGLSGRRLRYVTVERFGLFLSEPRWAGIRPTNGATMLATAVALQPRRLIVSGIDLFSHPAGTYPGDQKTPNAYSPGHNPDSELSLLIEALRGYRGELVILSEALRTAWGQAQHPTETVANRV